ncbi:OTU domain-containing protein 4 isoform X2 [Neoarius graeffei]|uniref:OTU domain-containing protein 4 isoform X2 n=1 Tax=Neoarius graeffei TaxID=443677 RepID=UPI00298D3FED|nr:OTU domain-containing protein 4 isoform X2 [Neoarius graeffei]
MQQNDEKSVEKLMDEQLKAEGLYRKKIAKDGSCLFRAVAEQVLHCQSLHTKVRAECVKYLRQERDLYESFIEGDFEEYLHMLQDPQSWVGQVEISALAVLYKHDFIIYQQPGEPPVNITQKGYPDQVRLCFLNGNHYDSVYQISSVKNAAMCQSILYELLYERVYGVDQSMLVPSLRVSRAKNETIEVEECESSGDSDLDEGEDFWSREATGRTAGVNNRTAYKGRGRGQARGVGRGCLLRKVQDSLSPTLFRNVEYEMWLRSKRVQQRRDFCMAAGMHYKAGDKCQVRLNNTDRFYSAYIQDVSPDDGPVTVFIKELGEKYSVPLWNLRTPSEDSWSTVTEKSKRQTAPSSNGSTSERDTKPGRKTMRSVSHGPTASSGSTPGNRIEQQHSWPPHDIIEPQPLGKNGSSRRSDQGTGGLCVSPVEEDKQALLELLNKDEENFPTLEASVQAASVEGSRRAEKKGSRKKASADTKEQSLNPIHKAERGKQAKKGSVNQDQRISPPPKEEPNPTPSTALPAPSAPKSTKASPASTTAQARVPYKTSSLSPRISSSQSQTVLAPSMRTPASLETTHIQSPTATVPFTQPQDSFQTAPIQSQTDPAPSMRSPASLKTTHIQSPTAPVPSTDSFQTTHIQSPSAPVPSTDSFQTTHIQSPTTPVPSTDSFQTTPIQSQTAPAPSIRTPASLETTHIQSPTAPVPSTRPQDSFQTTPIQSQTAPAPSMRTPASLETTHIQSPTAPVPSTRPQDSFQTAPIQSQTATVPFTRPIVLFENTSTESQATLEPSKMIPVSSQTTLVQPQTLPLPTTSVPTAVSSQCTPSQCLTVSKPILVTTTSLHQNISQTIQSQVSDPTASVTRPVSLNPVLEAATTPISFQMTTIPFSPATPALNPESTLVSSPSTLQTTPALTYALSQTTSATAQGPVPAPSQINSATEVPGSADLSADSKSPPAQTASEQSDSAGVPSPVHVPHSITPPAQPVPSFAPSYSVGFGTHLPYPPYAPYPAPVPSLSPNISAPMPDPCLPPAVPTPPFSHAAESYLYEPVVSPVVGAGGALVPDPPPQHSVTLAQLCQDPLYPGFPQNDKDELVQPPPFSRHNTGKDLPSDTNVLRFFFNLGLKAYMYQMLPPVTYLAPLVQAYHHMPKVSPPPVSWQQDNSRPIFPSTNPPPAGSTPVSHFEVRGMVRTPSPMEVGVFSHHSLPMQMPLSIASCPTVYAGVGSVPPAGPSLQYSAPPLSVGPQHLSVPPPRHYGIPIPTVPPIMEGGQGGQRSLTPQVEKSFWAGQSQQHSEGGDIKPGAVPVTMEIQHSSGAQAVLSGGVPSKGAEPTMLANGNRREKGGGFVGSSLKDWETEKVEFGDADLKSGRSYHNRSYKSGGRHGQDDRGGFRGRGSRGRREYTGWTRYDGQLPYHRGSGGRNRGRGYNNTRAAGYSGGQFAPTTKS